MLLSHLLQLSTAATKPGRLTKSAAVSQHFLQVSFQLLSGVAPGSNLTYICHTMNLWEDTICYQQINRSLWTSAVDDVNNPSQNKGTL